MLSSADNEVKGVGDASWHFDFLRALFDQKFK
jgi:hypothetical protein